MDRPGSQYTVVSYLITFWPLPFMWSYTGPAPVAGLKVHLRVHPANRFSAPRSPPGPNAVSSCPSPAAVLTLQCGNRDADAAPADLDRKSTRLNSSHSQISY